MSILTSFTLTTSWSFYLFLVTLVKTSISNSLNLISDEDRGVRRAEEYLMTSATIDGIKRSNVCGDGYRIEGALLKSYPFSKSETYLPNEDCYMTFKARRSDQQIRIRILSLDLNDIHGGVNCLDALRFYKSPYLAYKDKIDTVECGQLTEEQGFTRVSSTGIVTAHFSSDAGNVSGLGFKVVLTAFRSPNKTHPCDPNNDEFSCKNRDCISNLLICDNVPHCLDDSDESPHHNCAAAFNEHGQSNARDSSSRPAAVQRTHWRGIVIVAFLMIIFIVFVLLTISFVLRRFFSRQPITLINGERKNYATIVNSPMNGPRSSTTTTHVVGSKGQTKKRLDEDYNLL